MLHVSADYVLHVFVYCINFIYRDSCPSPKFQSHYCISHKDHCTAEFENFCQACLQLAVDFSWHYICSLEWEALGQCAFSGRRRWSKFHWSSGIFLKCFYAYLEICVCGACACVCIVCARACARVFLSRCVFACVSAYTCVRVRAYVVDIYMWILKYAHKQ